MKTGIRQIIENSRHNTRVVLQTADWINAPTGIKKDLIRKYTTAMAVNFTDWMGKTLPWVRHELGRYVIIDNLRCETENDHIQMLLCFSRSCDAIPDNYARECIDPHLERVRWLFGKHYYANLRGVVGLTVTALLENTSRDFIPVLEKVAVSLGAHDLTYTNVHGEADVAHSEQFVKALEAEIGMGYGSGVNVSILHVQERVGSLLNAIFKI